MTDPIHTHFLAQLQMLDMQQLTAHAFLDSKHVPRTDSQRQPYTLAERIAKMVGDLPAEKLAVDPLIDNEPEEIIQVWQPPSYSGFNFGPEESETHG